MIVNKINEDKEQLKLNIQKIFTRIRSELNNREDALILEIDKTYEEVYLKNDINREREKLPNKIKISLEKAKILDNEDNNNDNKLISIINDCVNIENNIKEINTIDGIMKKYKSSKNIEIQFIPKKEEDINKFLETIKIFGKININDINKFGGLCNSSLILNKEIDKESKIINWIEEKTNKHFIKFELLFRMSQNGSNSTDFHKYCNDKGPTLTLFYLIFF